MRQDIRKVFAAAVVVAVGGVWMGAPRPASAGVVHVEGSAVIFKAGNNEVNTVVVNARGLALDPATGQTVRGFTVNDSTARVVAGTGCKTFVAAVVCDVTNVAFVSVDLGDKDDRVSQQEGEPGDAVPMRVKGGGGNDVLIGSSRGDTLDGELGDDTLDGGKGDDVLEGGLGADTITGGPGSDSISGGPGKDVIQAADRERDAINCGLGNDSVTADAVDTKKRCN